MSYLRSLDTAYPLVKQKSSSDIIGQDPDYWIYQYNNMFCMHSLLLVSLICTNLVFNIP